MVTDQVYQPSVFLTCFSPSQKFGSLLFPSASLVSKRIHGSILLPFGI